MKLPQVELQKLARNCEEEEDREEQRIKKK